MAKVLLHFSYFGRIRLVN